MHADQGAPPAGRGARTMRFGLTERVSGVAVRERTGLERLCIADPFGVGHRHQRLVEQRRRTCACQLRLGGAATDRSARERDHRVDCGWSRQMKFARGPILSTCAGLHGSAKPRFRSDLPDLAEPRPPPTGRTPRSCVELGAARSARTSAATTRLIAPTRCRRPGSGGRRATAQGPKLHDERSRTRRRRAWMSRREAAARRADAVR